LFIDEIFNPKLQAEYDSFKLNAGATLEEVAVFHGTYFAKNASYSFNYMKSQDTKGISYMFFSRCNSY
jgi:hypothetical protein